jgi:hypothetical protein
VDVLGRLIGLRLAPEVIARVLQLVIEFFVSFAESIQALAQASRQFRQLCGTEEHKHNYKNNN